MNKNIIRIISIILILTLCFAMTSCIEPQQGKSAYELAVQNGFVGTLDEWLESLKGGPAGPSNYELAVQNGFEGTLAEWLETLKPLYVEPSDDSILQGTNIALLSAVNVVCTNNQTQSSGAGTIIFDDKAKGIAYIVTNHHVVYNTNSSGGISNNIKVYLYGSPVGINATYVGGSMTYDTAVLKINSIVYQNSNSRACTITSDYNIYVGQTAIAIGNPNGDGIAATKGIVSVDSESIIMDAIDQSGEIEYRVMRIDTAINKGNSGGGLFNAYGEFIGMVNAKTISEEVDNVGYALPAYQVVKVVNNIIRNCDNSTNTNVIRCILGITSATRNASTKVLENGLVLKTEEIIVSKVETNSPASNGTNNGIRVNDVIKSLTYNGDVVLLDRQYKLAEYTLNFVQGDKVDLEVLRNNQTIYVTITLTQTTTVK